MGDKIFEIKDSVRHQKKSYNGPKVVPTRESELRQYDYHTGLRVISILSSEVGKSSNRYEYHTSPVACVWAGSTRIDSRP